jgi:hypothetical protein
MYTNAKVTPVETVPGIRGGGIKERGGGGDFNMVYLIYCKNLCKCHMHPTQHNKGGESCEDMG